MVKHGMTCTFELIFSSQVTRLPLPNVLLVTTVAWLPLPLHLVMVPLVTFVLKVSSAPLGQLWGWAAGREHLGKVHYTSFLWCIS